MAYADGAVSATPSRTQQLVSAALIAALMAASAWITLPIGAVPVTLQVFFVVLAALLLTPGWAAASMGLYLALGAAGLPVFSGAKGGLGVLAGPTGGYLFGFFVAATLGAWLRGRLASRLVPVAADSIVAGLCVLVIYSIGTVQLALVANLTIGQALVAGVVPFIVPDIAKAAVAVAVAAAVRRAIAR